MWLRTGALVLLLAAALHADSRPGLKATSGAIAAAPRLFFADNETLSPGAGGAVTLAGRLSILRNGEYRFFVTGGRLEIDSAAIGDEPVRLESGQLEFVVRAKTGASRIQVEWQGPGFGREPIPARLLSHEAPREGLDGRALFEDLGCSNCHRSESPSIEQRAGPVLTGVGARVKPEWLVRWLGDPKSFRSWATMPRMLGESERADVAAFLMAQNPGSPEEPKFKTADWERGRTTFQAYGCVACHGPDEAPLAGLGSKTTAGSLLRLLVDPLLVLPDGRMPSFHLTEQEALELSAMLVESRDERFERPVELGDATRGRELIRSSGCLACHELDGVESSSTAPRLDSLDPSQGCLATNVREGLPRYQLSGGESKALGDFIESYRQTPDVAPAPLFDLSRRMTQLRCRACHEMNGGPPTGSLAEATPSLTDVGDKLRVDWLERVIGSRTQNLDWQELRMPSFGPSHAKWLASALAKASGVDPDEDPAGPAGAPEAGHGMLGVDGAQGGMGCVGCHGWDEFPPLGENGPNIYTTGQRMRYDWFRRWMRDPSRILTGTSMPNYFSGQDPAKADVTINSLWAAFRAAPELEPPAGFKTAVATLGSEEMPVPEGRAIVIRWDVPEATPAAINVGMPGGVSFTFDAGESRLRYAWLGGFLDMSPTLYTKKNKETNLTETAKIVGEIFFREGPGPIRVAQRERIPQRRFRGYKLVAGYPEFHYQVDGVDVYERIVPVERGIRRVFRIGKVSEAMWFVPAESEGVEIMSTLEGEEIPRGADVKFEVKVVATN